MGRTHGVHAEPTTFGLKLAGSHSRPTATCARLRARRRETSPWASSRGAVGHLLGTSAPRSRPRVLPAAGPARARPCRRRWCRATATPSCSSADRPGRRRARALRHRGAPPAAHRGARGRRSRSAQAARRARRPCRTSATRSSSERITGHRPAAARLRAGRARGRGALARARHLALLGGARGPARRDDRCSTTRQHLAIRVVDGMVVHEERMRAQPRAHPRRALLPAGAAGPGGGRPLARRGLPGGAGGSPARRSGGCPTYASCWPRPRRCSTSTAFSTRAPSCATHRQSSRDSNSSPVSLRELAGRRPRA